MKNLHQSDGSMRLAGPGAWRPFGGSFGAVGAESGNNVDVVFQLLDAQGQVCAVLGVPVLFYIGVDTPGDLTVGAAITNFTFLTNPVKIVNLGTTLAALSSTLADGTIIVRGNFTGTGTRRFVAVLPGGLAESQSGTATWA
jgi:hypothetical protein